MVCLYLIVHHVFLCCVLYRPDLTRLHCPHVNVSSRTYTRIYTKVVLDHILIFDPSNIKSVPKCNVLTKLAGQEFPKKLQDWLEISDHYPVFATFFKIPTNRKHPMSLIEQEQFIKKRKTDFNPNSVDNMIP